ncbi:MAG TPA: hypothetical protein V6D12_10235 [Candidatus Obscuribacterales bacterium]
MLKVVSDRLIACLRLPNIVQEGDRIHVYPVLTTPAVTSPVCILRFVLNVHLGKMNFLTVFNIVSFI